MSRHWSFLGLAFGSGFAVLTIEIAGARLIAPVFGLSVVPWTAVIGVILGALAAGSHVGGRLADAGRIPLSRILFAAALTGTLPVLGVGFPWLARDLFGFIPGAVVSAVVLFAPPVFCLGSVVPYLVQAETDTLGTVGRRAGDISAAATAGSIVGSFTTGFVLLPAMPLTLLLGLTAAGLVALSLWSARLLGGSVSGVGAALVALALPALGVLAARPAADTLYASQTVFSSVRVTDREWADGRVVRELWQNGGSSSAEYRETGDPAHIYARTSLTILQEIREEVDDVLVLGGAALTLPVALKEWSPDAAVDVVEIDPEVTRLAGEFFAYGRSDGAGIEVIHEDARIFLRSEDRLYDLVYLDVFDHLLTVPWTMVTREAFGDMAARLGPGGLFMANVLSPLEGPGSEFLWRLRATLESEFEDTRIYLTDPDIDPGATQNLIVVAAREPGAIGSVDWPEVSLPAAGRPFTDAWAPVEYLQAKVFVQGLRWR